MTSWPCSASRAAATDESTPPDIATTILATSADALLCEPADLCDQPWQHLNHAIDFALGRIQPQTEAQGVLRPVRREAHRAQHVRGLERARRAGRSGRHRDAFEVECDQQALGFDVI